jgi:hypothetical protein
MFRARYHIDRAAQHLLVVLATHIGQPSPKPRPALTT